MTGLFPEVTEVRRSLHQPRAEVMHPDAVDDDPCEERMLSVGEHSGKGEATSARGQLGEFLGQVRLPPS